MEKENIKPGHIYYVDYDPIKKGEFGYGKHLSLILKANNGGQTYIAIPMTSKCYGIRGQQVDLGYLKCLPKKYRRRKTYAIVNQTRSISPERVETVNIHGEPIDIKLAEGRLKKIRTELAKVYLDW